MGERRDGKKAGAEAPENLPLWRRQGEKPDLAHMLGTRTSVDAPKARGVRPVYLPVARHRLAKAHDFDMAFGTDRLPPPQNAQVWAKKNRPMGQAYRLIC